MCNVQSAQPSSHGSVVATPSRLSIHSRHFFFHAAGTCNEPARETVSGPIACMCPMPVCLEWCSA